MVRPIVLLLERVVVVSLLFGSCAGAQEAAKGRVARGAARAEGPVFRVAADGTGEFRSVQEAIDRVPDTGGVVVVAPGVYRGQVLILKSHVTLRGGSRDASKTVLVDDTSQGTRGSKESYATVHVLGDDFRAENLTFENDFNRTHQQVYAGSQAQALNLQGDRNVVRNVRILGNQDTLYVGPRGCGQSGSRLAHAADEQSPAGCISSGTRSYFKDCVVAGNVDFIYGDGNAVFDHCEIHSTLHSEGFLTAQGKYKQDLQSVFVFDDCRLTADAGVTNVYLGRPWRPYASVVFLHTEMGAQVMPAGWREWHPGETHSLDTAFFAEYRSTGPGADVRARELKSHQLSKGEAKRFRTRKLLEGTDGWRP